MVKRMVKFKNYLTVSSVLQIIVSNYLQCTLSFPYPFHATVFFNELVMFGRPLVMQLQTLCKSPCHSIT